MRSLEVAVVALAFVFLGGCATDPCNTYSGSVTADESAEGVWAGLDAYGDSDADMLRGAGGGVRPPEWSGRPLVLNYRLHACRHPPDHPVSLIVWADIDGDDNYSYELPGPDPGEPMERVEFLFGDGDQETHFTLTVP